MDSKEDNKFLGLEIDKHLNWKKHIEEILPKLSSACYTVRSMYYTSSITTLTKIYFAYFHLKLAYGIISGELQLIVKEYSSSKRRWSDSWLVQIVEHHVNLYLVHWEF
jgi:hypothetical protein